MASKPKFLPINLAPYNLHVVITWETKAEEIERYLKAHKATVAKDFKEEFEGYLDKGILGLCMKPSDDSPDVLVWLAQRPKKASSYGTLYHELYHAVDSVSESRNMDDEVESRAYIFEYLATQANRFFWAKR